MDTHNNIFYISMIDDQCTFKEILPDMDRDSEHNTIYEIKSESIFLSQDGDKRMLKGIIFLCPFSIIGGILIS